MIEQWKSYAPQLQSLLRITAAVIFIQSGTMKLFGWPIPMPGGMTLDLFSQIGLAAVLEALGGLLMLLGLWTRPVAFILSGQMAVAYFQAHAPKAFWTIENGGGPAVMFCFVWLYFSAAGAGPWSVDSILRKKHIV